MAADTPGLLLALRVTAAGQHERSQVFDPAADVRAATGPAVAPAVVDRGYTGDPPAADAQAGGIALAVVRSAEPKRGFVPLPRRRVAERSFGWPARSRRPAGGHERTAAVLVGWHWVGFAGLMLTRVMESTQEPLDPGS